MSKLNESPASSPLKIVLLGAGNVATCLGKALTEHRLKVSYVYSRRPESARTLGQTLSCAWGTDASLLPADADLYLCCLKDDALPEVLASVGSFGHGLWLHTSGSVPMSVFAAYTDRYGVMYPLQTFSKAQPISFDHVPLCIEAALASDLDWLNLFASRLSQTVVKMDSAKRAVLHLSAVFVCNFTNSLYAMAQELLAREDLDFALLLPLIDETAAKVHRCLPVQAQTGPAMRMDRSILDKHLAMLQADPDKAALYEALSRSIYQRYQS